MFLSASPAGATPPECRVGAYLTDLYSIDMETNSFGARLDLWSTCSNPSGYDPVPGMELPEASKIERQKVTTQIRDGVRWSRTTIQGTFHHNWDTSHFPFDRHTLRITLHPALDKGQFTFATDLEDSRYRKQIRTPDFTLTGYRVVPGRLDLGSRFGDIRRPETDTAYDTLDLTIALERSGVAEFITLIGPLYLAIVVTLIACFLIARSNDVMLGRLGLIGSALFTVVVNLQVAQGGLSGQLSLTDQLHILGLVYTVGAIAVTVVCWKRMVRGQHIIQVKELNRRAMGISTLLYAAANTALVLLARFSG